MSDIAELMARLASMKDSTDSSGGSGGGGRAEGFHAAEGASSAITNLEYLSSDGQSFGMGDRIKGLEDVLSPSVSLDDLVKIKMPNLEYVTFDFIEKFMPIAIRSKLAVIPQKNFLLGGLQPPHIAVGGLKTAFGKGEEGQGQ